MARHMNGLVLWLVVVGLTHAGLAETIHPTGYDMRGGDESTFRYFDQTYAGGTGPQVFPAQQLSGGSGVLTDGIIATDNWFIAENGDGYHPYVGWHSIDPTLTFHFPQPVHLNAVTIFADNSGGDGGVLPPSTAHLQMGLTNVDRSIHVPPGTAPFAYTLTDLNLFGSTLALTLDRAPFSDPCLPNWVFLSEVQFSGTTDAIPAPAAAAGGIALIIGLAIFRRATKALQRTDEA